MFSLWNTGRGFPRSPLLLSFCESSHVDCLRSSDYFVFFMSFLHLSLSLVSSATLIGSAQSWVYYYHILNMASQELLKIKYVENYKYLKYPGAGVCTVFKHIFLIWYILFACLCAGSFPSVGASEPVQTFRLAKDPADFKTGKPKSLLSIPTLGCRK